MWSGKLRKSWIPAFATANWSTSFIGLDTDLTRGLGNLRNIFRTPPKPSLSFSYSIQIVLRLETFPLARLRDPDVERAYLRRRTRSIPDRKLGLPGEGGTVPDHVAKPPLMRHGQFASLEG